LHKILPTYFSFSAWRVVSTPQISDSPYRTVIRLLAIPSSCNRISGYNLYLYNVFYFYRISSDFKIIASLCIETYSTSIAHFIHGNSKFIIQYNINLPQSITIHSFFTFFYSFFFCECSRKKQEIFLLLNDYYYSLFQPLYLNLQSKV
jgi:hypothetical protein